MKTKATRTVASNECDETKITGKWKATARFMRSGKKNTLPRRFVHNQGVHRIENAAIQQEIVNALRSGLEVRLFGGSIRLYHCVDEGFRTMYVAASVMSESPIRSCVSDIAFEFTRGGVKADVKDVEKLKRKIRAEQREQHVTADTLVTCPECGCRFRVGKSLV